MMDQRDSSTHNDTAFCISITMGLMIWTGPIFDLETKKSSFFVGVRSASSAFKARARRTTILSDRKRSKIMRGLLHGDINIEDNGIPM
jgi:hypothetical protein